jgi:hypothetical protein
MSVKKWSGVLAALGVAWLAVACGADGEAAPAGGDYDSSGSGDGTATGTGTGGTGTGGTDTGGTVTGSTTGALDGLGGAGSEPVVPDLPAEQEQSAAFQAPVVTGRYLWSPNPQSGRVALIDAESRTARVLSAGLYPTYVAAVSEDPDEPAAIVLNVGSSDASYYRLKDGAVSEKRVDVHPGANAWSVSGSGRWAAAYSVPTPGLTIDPTEGLQSLTLIDLGAKSPSGRALTVGYRPEQVVFDEAEERLFVVSEEGISVIALGSSPEVERWVALGSSADRDIAITADGKHALVRSGGVSEVRLIPLLTSDAPLVVPLSGPATDLDLSASGRATVVVRSKSQLVTFLVSEVLGDVSAVDAVTLSGELVGSAELAPDGSRALLYLTAADNDRVSIVTLEPGDDFLAHRALSTKSPVGAVNVGPDGDHAVVLAKSVAGATTGSFTVLSLDVPRFPRIVGTDAPVRHVGMSAGGAIVTTTSSALYEAYVIELPSLSVETRRLASPPLSAGILPALGQAFAAQVHPAGRVTFFDIGTGEARTLTGFELSAEVVQ